MNEELFAAQMELDRTIAEVNLRLSEEKRKMEGNSKNDRSVYSATPDTPDGFVQPEGQALYVVEEMDTFGAIIREYVVEAASKAAAKNLIAAGRFKARSASARDVARLYGAEIVKASVGKDRESTIAQFADRIVGEAS